MKDNRKRNHLYSVWREMNRRCYSPNNCNYHKYGAKGIRVYEEWKRACDGGKDGFKNFEKWALNNGYKPGLTIDRLNPYKNYSPDNCRWVDYYNQNNKLTIKEKNTSGYVGISRNSHGREGWRVRISAFGKRIQIGIYKEKKEAVEARNKFIIDNNLSYPIQEWIGEDGYTKDTYQQVFK